MREELVGNAGCWTHPRDSFSTIPGILHFHEVPERMLKIFGPHCVKQAGSKLELELSSFYSSSVAGPLLGNAGATGD